MHLTDNTFLHGGKYKVVRFISSGGFGCTYEGIHTTMDTRVAIKEFFPKMLCNRDENTSRVTVAAHGNKELVDKLKKKFNEEGKAIFQMKHGNIVRVLDIFEDNDTTYYVMEYIDGKSLNDIVKERGGLPEAEAVGYIRQVADALKHVHSLNRLHLDIKPGNIMVDRNDKAILIDFGASKHYDEESGENTTTLMGVNTQGYAPIEQSTQGFTTFSPATDIYALGATLYKLLTGIVPPDANLLLAEEQTLQPLPQNISSNTRNAVEAALKLRRKDRPQTIDDFLRILDAKQNAEANPSRATDNGKEAVDDEQTLLMMTDNAANLDHKSGRTEQRSNRQEAKSHETSNSYTSRTGALQSSKRKKASSRIVRYCLWGLLVLVTFGVIGSFLDSGSTNTFTDAAGQVFEYEGEMADNKPNGEGVGIYPDGTYRGAYVNGLREGNGTMINSDSTLMLQGVFEKDCIVKGKLILLNGSEYFEGTFKGTYKDLKYDNGIVYKKDGSGEVGKYKNGEYHELSKSEKTNETPKPTNSSNSQPEKREDNADDDDVYDNAVEKTNSSGALQEGEYYEYDEYGNKYISNGQVRFRVSD